MNKKYLETVYDLQGKDETRSFYDDWSASYDDEVRENGYATPARAAAALRSLTPDLNAPLLDIGCGTGMSGEAMHAAGFTTIDGTDFSPEMLAKARAKGVYRNLVQTDLTDPLPFAAGDYTSIAAIGVLTPGHAPADVMDDLLALLPRAGRLVFSLNDHALQDRSYAGRLRENTDCGHAIIEFKEHGPHLPKIGLKSTVYVLRKAF
ncbi:methyltransferase domain-containing protein [Algicella marina]|uniref:Methyltransferase domain-containing protein n=2 Tax=Algicella marina TaxID=2683284 RepID=A0A6P1T7L7_9RHOB|nr:class I SAM-dependent methyltransferase [Algicella marina]QHQ37289.1 methyltransferase domain-containing protein [Algicella marina]